MKALVVTGVCKEKSAQALTGMSAVRISGVLALAVLAGCQTPPAGTPLRPAPASVLAPDTPSDPLHPLLRMTTTLGDIVFELNAEDAPTTVLNFIGYVEAGEYDGTIFHRVVPDSLLQGGAFTPDMSRRRRVVPPMVPDNWHIELHGKPGTIALIRRTDRVGDGTAQFFINLVEHAAHEADPNHGQYAVFGKVVAGQETIERIRNTPLNVHPKYAAGLSPVVPVTPVVIETARMETAFDADKAWEVIGARNIDPRTAILKRFGKEAADNLIETGSGLMYVDLIKGNGPRTPGAGDTIEFQYRGTFLDGREFENSFDTRPTVRTVASLVPGLREAVRDMTEGGLRVAVVPPELAYPDGIPNIIPPGATLIYEIELLEIQ